MKHKVADLSGALLDAAVGKALGYTPEQFDDWAAQGGRTARSFLKWYWGGPFIERERIAVEPSIRGGWQAHSPHEADVVGMGFGPTPLIAVMRAYCASKFGKEVELP